MVGARITNKSEKMYTKFQSENRKRRGYFEDLGVYMRIILKML
jgi:hypothetical protein